MRRRHVLIPSSGLAVVKVWTVGIFRIILLGLIIWLPSVINHIVIVVTTNSYSNDCHCGVTCVASSALVVQIEC